MNTAHLSPSEGLPTPDISHLTPGDYDCIYEPAEDTFLLLDSLERDANRLRDLKPAICVEIGTGSGIVVTFLAKLLGSSAAYFCVDINPRAVEVAMATGRRNDVLLLPVVADLTSPFEDRLRGLCDVLVFNPPYVVTSPEEVDQTGLAAAWAGGSRGREVMDRLFPAVFSILSPGGVFYLLIIKENDEGEIVELLGSCGLTCEPVLRRKSGPEFLSVLRFTKPTIDGAVNT